MTVPQYFFFFSIQDLGTGAQAPSNCSHEAPYCTLESAAVETAVESTSRRDSSTVLRRGKSRGPSSILVALAGLGALRKERKKAQERKKDCDVLVVVR